jgi:hypothetical protein
MLAGKKTGYFIGLFRQAVQKQAPAAAPENEVLYASEQDYRQALLDRGVHPTLLPPPPRDFNERPPIIGDLKPPKPPPGWQWVLCKTNESADVDSESAALDKEQPDPPTRSDLATGESAELDKGQPQPAARLNAAEDNRSQEIKNSTAPDYDSPISIPGWRLECNPYTKRWFAVRAGSPRTIWRDDFKV